MKTSAGVLMYRIKNGLPAQTGKPEVLLVHPGGPFWAKKDEGSWSIPKGEADNNETVDELLDVAKREFEEETGFKAEGNFKYLGEVKKKNGKPGSRPRGFFRARRSQKKNKPLPNPPHRRI